MQSVSFIVRLIIRSRSGLFILLAKNSIYHAYQESIKSLLHRPPHLNIFELLSFLGELY